MNPHAERDELICADFDLGESARSLSAQYQMTVPEIRAIVKREREAKGDFRGASYGSRAGDSRPAYIRGHGSTGRKNFVPGDIPRPVEIAKDHGLVAAPLRKEIEAARKSMRITAAPYKPGPLEF